MALVCCITGEAPDDPVVTRAGFVFSKRMLEKYLRDNDNKCPMTGEPLTSDDWIPVNTTKTTKPRPPAAASVPGLLTLLQEEWDANMVETFTLRNHLDALRNQLSHTLYQHDAACRVIARLIRERDNARLQVTQLQQQLASSRARAVEGVGGGETVEQGISERLIEEMADLAKKLLAGRKRRTVEGLLPLEGLKAFERTGNYSLHQSTAPGVLCVKTDPKGTLGSGRVIATGGVDGVVALFDIEEKKTLTKLVGHLKPVNGVIVHPSSNVVVSASADRTCRVWVCSDDETLTYRSAHILRAHSGAVHDLSLHPLRDYFVTAGADHSWAFHELDSGRTLRTVLDLPCQYRSIQFHPDGMILGGGGTDGKIHIWDMKDGQKHMVALAGHTGPINKLAFSENGYYLATASDDGTVRLWDLRKSVSFQTIDISTAANYTGASVTFDHTGNYIAVGGGEGSNGVLSIHHFEQRANTAMVTSLAGHTGLVTDVCWGPNAEYLVSASMDRYVSIWEPKKAKQEEEEEMEPRDEEMDG